MLSTGIFLLQNIIVSSGAENVRDAQLNATLILLCNVMLCLGYGTAKPV